MIGSLEDDQIIVESQFKGFMSLSPTVRVDDYYIAVVKAEASIGDAALESCSILEMLNSMNTNFNKKFDDSNSNLTSKINNIFNTVSDSFDSKFNAVSDEINAVSYKVCL